MKRLVVVIVVLGLAAVGVYYGVGGDQPALTDATPPPPNLGIWEQPLPPGTVEVGKEDVDLKVEAVRKNRGDQTILEFHITEEHGYLVDGIQLFFWHRMKDPETGEFTDDPRRIEYFVKKRLDFGEELVDYTVLKPVEFEHLGIDIHETTSEDWKAIPANFKRAAKKTG